MSETDKERIAKLEANLAAEIEARKVGDINSDRRHAATEKWRWYLMVMVATALFAQIGEVIFAGGAQ